MSRTIGQSCRSRYTHAGGASRLRPSGASLGFRHVWSDLSLDFAQHLLARGAQGHVRAEDLRPGCTLCQVYSDGPHNVPPLQQVTQPHVACWLSCTGGPLVNKACDNSQARTHKWLSQTSPGPGAGAWNEKRAWRNAGASVLCCGQMHRCADCLAMSNKWLGSGTCPADGVVREELDQHAQQRERKREQRARRQVPAACAVCRRRSCCCNLSPATVKSK